MHSEDSQNSDNVENSKKQSNHGGVRPGAGRKPGGANQSTIERAAVKKEFQDRVANAADRLFHAQMNLAEGVTHLFRVDKDSKGKNLPAVLVEDTSEIKDFIDGRVDRDSYYYIASKAPNNLAIDSMLNRAFGKAEETLDLKSSDGSMTPKAPADQSVVDSFVSQLKSGTADAPGD